MTKPSRPPLSQAASIAAFAAALAGCGRGASTASSTPPLAALPLTDASAPLAPAPATSSLPRTGPARVARLRDPRDAYAYLDRAYAQGYAYGDAPPDYTFDYDGVRPWVWRADDDASRYAEPLPGGGYRYFYYDPGAATPYFVQDGEYGYGYSGDELSVVYGRGGRVLPPAYVDQRAIVAGALLARARSVYAASRRADRLAVARANWDARRSEIAAQRAGWSRQQAQDDAWRAYHDAHQADYQAHWSVERERREAEAARLAGAENRPAQAREDLRGAGRAADQSGAGALAMRRADRLQRDQAGQVEQERLQAQRLQPRPQEIDPRGGGVLARPSGPDLSPGGGHAPAPPPAGPPGREGGGRGPGRPQARREDLADKDLQVQAARDWRRSAHEQVRHAAEARHAEALQAEPARGPQGSQEDPARAGQAAEGRREQAARSRDAEQMRRAHQSQPRQAGEAERAQAAQARRAEQAERDQRPAPARRPEQARPHVTDAPAHDRSEPHPAPPAGPRRPPEAGPRPADGRDHPRGPR